MPFGTETWVDTSNIVLEGGRDPPLWGGEWGAGEISAIMGKTGNEKFSVEYLENGDSYDVGLNWGHIGNRLWAFERDLHIWPWMTLRGQRSRSHIFDGEYLENSSRYGVGPNRSRTGNRIWAIDCNIQIWPWATLRVKGQGHNISMLNITKTAADTMLDSMKLGRKSFMGFGLLFLYLKLRDLKKSKVLCEENFAVFNCTRSGQPPLHLLGPC